MHFELELCNNSDNTKFSRDTIKVNKKRYTKDIQVTINK